MSDNYPSDWNKRRKRIYERDDHTCQNCGIKGGDRGGAQLHAHHIVPVSRGGSHKLSNLTSICERCHKAVHNDGMYACSKEQKSSDINPDDFEGETKAILEIVENINSVFDIGTDTGSIVTDMIKYVKKMFKYSDEPGDEVPDKLEQRYVNKYQKVAEGVSQLRKILLEIRDIQSQNDFGESFNSKLEEYVDKCETFVRTIDEMVLSLDAIVSVEGEGVELQVVTKDSVEFDADLHLVMDKFADAIDELMDSKSGFEDAVSNYVN